MGGGSKGGATNRLAAAPASSAVARLDPSPRLLWQPVTHAPAFTPPSLPSPPPPPLGLARCHVLAAQSASISALPVGQARSERGGKARRPPSQTESEREGEEIDAIFFFWFAFLSPPTTSAPPPPQSPGVSEQMGETGWTAVAAPPLAWRHRWSDEGRGRGGGGQSGLFVSSCAFQLPQKIFVSWPAGAPTARHSLPARARVRRPPAWSPPPSSLPTHPPTSLFPVSPVAREGRVCVCVCGGGEIGSGRVPEEWEGPLHTLSQTQNILPPHSE